MPSVAEKPLCFAIMPITTPEDAVAQYGGDSDHFIHVAEFIFKPAAELAGYNFIPASVDSSKVIQAAIIDNLAHAEVVLCDTSLWNANVFFELGIRVALDKPVALVRDRLTTSIPFDNTPVHCYEYDHRMEPWCIKTEIPKLAEHIKATGRHERNELWKFAGIQVSAQQSVPNSPEDAKLDLLLTEMRALGQQSSSLQQQVNGISSIAQQNARRSLDQVLLETREQETQFDFRLQELNKVLGEQAFQLDRIDRGEVFVSVEDEPHEEALDSLTRMTKRVLPSARSIRVVEKSTNETIRQIWL